MVDCLVFVDVILDSHVIVVATDDCCSETLLFVNLLIASNLWLQS